MPRIDADRPLDERLGRRAMLGVFGAAASAPAIRNYGAGSGNDDALLGVATSLGRCQAERHALERDTPAPEAAVAWSRDLYVLLMRERQMQIDLAALPALTASGTRAKAAVIAQLLTGGTTDTRMLGSLLKDLLGTPDHPRSPVRLSSIVASAPH